jgi:RNA polymerase sigma factor (sigma-70 family)
MEYPNDRARAEVKEMTGGTLSHSITAWLGKLEAGDPAAVEQIWDRYFTRLVKIAQERLRDLPPQVNDEEDVALSAFHTFCQAVSDKRVSPLKNRDDLWRILVLITAGKTIDQRRRHLSRKRGGGRVAKLRDFSDEYEALEALIGREPDPAVAAQLSEELNSLLNKMPDEGLRRIALLKLEGYTQEEIASRMEISLRSVARRLEVIRRTWEASLELEAPED